MFSEICVAALFTCLVRKICITAVNNAAVVFPRFRVRCLTLQRLSVFYQEWIFAVAVDRLAYVDQ